MSNTPTSTVDTARLPVLLSQLRLPTVALLWPALTETADRESWPGGEDPRGTDGARGRRAGAAANRPALA